MNRKAFTLVELLAVIAILGIIGLIVFPAIDKTIKNTKEKIYKEQISAIELGARKWGGNNTDQLPEVGSTYISIDDIIAGGYLEDKELKDPRTNKKMNGCVVVTFNNEYNQYEYKYHEENCEDLRPKLVDKSGANAPVLAQGMTPIIWNGTDWVEPTETEDPYTQDWYNYGEKKWANAKTADGSFWVWIPRYAYKITSGYHTSTAGTIDVKFLTGETNTTKDGTTIETSGYVIGVKDTSMHYFKHPAFTFGNKEVEGIWVAKFEPSVPTDNLCYTNESTANCNVSNINPRIIPNVKSWRFISIKNLFNVSRSMETSPIYGWGTSGDNIDTHPMKNIEWGAVTYLAQSIYGKNNEIWNNPNSNWLTGCAGISNDLDGTTSCEKYNTSNGVQASTTGNIYGIYDMRGGASEYVMANLNNLAGEAGISPSSIADKYIDRYTSYTDNKYGDAMYETNLNQYSWYSDTFNFPTATYPWPRRGGNYLNTKDTGLYTLWYYHGNAYEVTFRPIIIVGTDL